MDRIHNWKVWLVHFAQVVEGQGFEWGRTDCVSLARRALRTMYGKDPWKGHVGEWTTRRGALRVAGRTDYEDALRSSGASQVGTLFASAGDVAVGTKRDRHGMFPVAVVLPGRKALISSPERGVFITGTGEFVADTTFWRYG